MRPPPSSAKSPVTGKCGFCYFPDRFLRQTCVYMYIMLLLFLLFVFVLCCAEKWRRRDGSRHRLITERAKTDEISVLSLLSSYLRLKVSKEGQLSYSNFVRGLLLDGMQPLIDCFEVLGTLCCTICEVPRRAENQKGALLHNPWNSVTYRKSKGSIVTQSVSFCNSSKAKRGVIIWSVRFRNLTKRKQVLLRNS